MEFTQQEATDGIVIALRGSFTFKDYHGFRAVLDALVAAPGSSRTLDLSQVDFLDSAALGMLLIANDEAARIDATLTLRNPSPQITQLFQLSSFDNLFRIQRV